MFDTHLTHAVVDGGSQGLESMIWEDVGTSAASVANEHALVRRQ